MKSFLSCLAFLGAPLALTAAEFLERNGEPLFVRRILPLLGEKCLACHGRDPSKIKGGLDLRTAGSAVQGGESGKPAFTAGKPEESPLYLAALRTHEDWEPMPPKEAERLSPEQAGWIRDWILAGAPWPEPERSVQIRRIHEAEWSVEDGVVVETSGGLSPEWTRRTYRPEGLWAYQPVRKPALPSGATHPVDALLARRMPAGLEPAPRADRRTLLRRVTFDLHGLPPSPEEVEAFVQDARPEAEAFGAVVERLLASPHYGERMARHWLDVTRYADSSGFSNDYERGNAWRYRDYVVRAFNLDKPYDRFIREQIAGDEIDPGNPENLVATGFLRMGPWELTGMEVERIARQRFLDDVVNSVGETFLAHSLQCARCHDHKFDPVPTRDYYAIQAVFATTQLAERAAPFVETENTRGFEERGYLEKTRAQHQALLEQLDAVLLENARQWFAAQGRDPSRWNAAVEAVRAALPARGGALRGGQLFEGARKRLSAEKVPEAEYPPRLVGFTPEQFGLERVARKGLERLLWEFDRYEPFALAVYSGRTREYRTVFTPIRMPAGRLTEGELEASCIRIGGDPFSEGPAVQPGVLSVLGGIQKEPVPDGVEGRRRAFAEWVAAPSNPLTTRSIVNRVWMWHFGEPIAGNPNNFGSTGKRPVNPELLDWLAATFVERGWSFKAMHRLILSSDAYARGAVHPDPRSLRECDPAGETCSVFTPRRLSAEELRDALLAASGELNPEMGGIPVRPEIHPEAALQPRQVMGTFASAWVASPLPSQRHRRSLYAHQLRGQGDPAMEVFNAPGPDFSCERREASTVTPQVFTLFNGKAAAARALALAHRVLRETGSGGDPLGRCFLLVFGRPGREGELEACRVHWREMEAVHARRKPVRERPPLEVRRDAVEENTGEKFSFTETLHAHADFVPDLQPADCDARTRALAEVCLVLINSNEFAYVY